VTRVQRELFESSLLSAHSVLELMGQPTDAIQLTIQRFRQHNLELFEQLHPHYKDSAKLISVVKQGRLQFEEQMARERGESVRKS
jgi:glutathione-regulated potassium-efflux system ancillary protein KefC